MKTVRLLLLTALLLPASVPAGEEKAGTLEERKQNITDEQLREFMEKKEEYRDNPEAMKFIESVEKELGITEEDLERAQEGAERTEGDGNTQAQQQQPAPVAGNAQVAEQAYRSGDYETARQHYEALAAEGDGYANLVLGLMYQQGQGVDADRSKAHAYYERASDYGDDRGNELTEALKYEMTEEQLKKAQEEYSGIVEQHKEAAAPPAGEQAK